MDKHTPGPWVVDRSHPDWVEGTTIWANDVVIAHAVADQHHQTEANARLIAAAPDLLIALRNLLEVVEQSDVAYHPAHVAAMYALIKATGESK